MTTACFIDHQGIYLPLAQKLSESWRIIYTDPCEQAFPKVNQAVIGDGFDNIERVRSFWERKSEIDLFVFPDSKGAGLQAELMSQGFPVWGARNAETLEHSREKFHQVLADVGLEVPKFERVIGVNALRDYLKDKENKYIKISRYRGSLETTKFRSMDDDEGLLDSLKVQFGGIANHLPFLVFDEIKTDLELGLDTYCINGKFPSHMMDGYEHKDRGYFAAFKPFEELPEQTKMVLDAFSPVLEKEGIHGFWSMEMRVKGDHTFFGDATPRAPLPAIGAEMEMYKNLPEIIMAGANGEIINPESDYKYAAECVLTLKGDDEAWGSVKVPNSLKQWMKLGGACYVDGRVWFPPDDSHGEEIGWLVAVGNTPKETLQTMLDHAEQLPDGVSAATDSMVDLIKEIESAEDQGIEFTNQNMPEPAEVLE